MFQKARDSAPCVIFFDELDSLCPRRSESREVIPRTSLTRGVPMNNLSASDMLNFLCFILYVGNCYEEPMDTIYNHILTDFQGM